MRRSNWAARRAADRPPKNEKRTHDEQNAEAAAVILDHPDRHPAFMCVWARRFMQRRTAELSESTVIWNS